MGSVVEWAKKIDPPLRADIKCTYIKEDTGPQEHGIGFEVDGKSYISWVPDITVDVENRTLRVIVAGSYKDGSYLVYLPADTLTTGRGLRISKDAPEMAVHVSCENRNLRREET